ncbi:hypothetical protein ADK64_27665 [Streptomyces sp. MMG1121]|nr:hypothetical protein ADK64_27665 [Streptomyces sp. MMG1121]
MRPLFSTYRRRLTGATVDAFVREGAQGPSALVQLRSTGRSATQAQAAGKAVAPGQDSGAEPGSRRAAGFDGSDPQTTAAFRAATRLDLPD